MIVCVGCGHANGGQDTFCGSCGGFLEWDGQPVAAAPARVPVPRQDPAPEPAVVETARPPERERVRPAPLRPDPVDLGPADLYCGGCGAGNAAGRHFCRRCGAPLADAVAGPRRGWWRRLRDRVSRRSELAAGERPKRWDGGSRGQREQREGPRRRWRRPRMPMRLSLGKAALPLAVLSLAGFGIAPVRAHVTGALFGAYHHARVRVAPHYVPVLPSGASASSALRGHGAAAAVDGNLLTWWSEGAPGRGHGQRLVVRFDRPTDLDRMTFHNGAAGATYPFQPRLRAVRVTLIGSGGVLQERRVPLADNDAKQVVAVSGHGVTRVVVRVLTTYAGQRSAAASLAEVGFLSAQ